MMRKVLSVVAVLLTVAGCELLENPLGYEEEYDSYGSTDSGSYRYTYTCPAGTKVDVEIPNRLSASCKSAWEFFARTYGCNDADRFAEANSRMAACP